jgi:hypothetical protein
LFDRFACGCDRKKNLAHGIHVAFHRPNETQDQRPRDL